MAAHSIYGYIHLGVSLNNGWCKIRGYFGYIGGCTFFYTFAAQAFYRFCRILYGTNSRLQSFSLHAMLSVSLWLLTALELLPSLIIGDIEYILDGYHCQFSPTSFRGTLTLCSIGFLLPFSVTIFFYTWTMCSIRRRSMALLTIDQRASIHRDIVIMKRLLILLNIITAVSLPHVLLPVIYTIVGSLPQWIVPLEVLLTELAVLAVAVVLFMITPQLRQLRKTTRVVDFVRQIPMILPRQRS